MAYTIISQNNTTTTLSDENGNVITVPARVTLATSTDYTITKVNNNSVDLEDGDGKIIRGVPACVVLAGEGDGGGGLPDQTGQSGKFLTTDGTDASWSDKPLVNKATGTDSLSLIGNGSTSNYAINIGSSSIAGSYCIAIGKIANVQANDSIGIGNYTMFQHPADTYSVAIGYRASIGKPNAIQINVSGNVAQNDVANTFKVANQNGNYEIMSADGTVPTARLTKVNTTATLAVADWSSNTQTVTVNGVKADSVVFVSPAPASASDYASAGILCTAQAANSLTFTCTTTPTNAITVNVVCM